ncbi:hypothetical protein C8J57DRAFT_319223 [Mycena rebaudengoi]|nr:hypothetical protein C8J57DRAFT_319223 [Mycena rebaudengoi]
MFLPVACRLAPTYASARVARAALFSSTSRCQAPKSLPAAPAGSEPLNDSDFAQYLTPLYDNGWGMSASTRGRKSTASNSGMLNRSFSFDSREQLSEFIKKTPTFGSNETAPNAIVSRNKDELRIFLTSPRGLTGAQLRLAIEAEKEYQDLLGPALQIEQAKSKFHISSLGELQRLANANSGGRQRSSDNDKIFTPTMIMPTRAALPAPPAAPTEPAPPISEEQMATYLAPLSTHGWHITGIASNQKLLYGYASLRRVYTFKDAVSAWGFLPSVLKAVPILFPRSLAGPELALQTTDMGIAFQVSLTGVLAEGAPRKYGVTLGHLRTAIELENMYLTEFAEHSARQTLQQF